MQSDSTNIVPAPADMPEVSIASSAFLVELSMPGWLGRKQDKKATEEVNRLHGARPNVATVKKGIMGECAELDAIHKFTARARVEHYAMTMPWSDMGHRLLTCPNYFGYNERMTELGQKHETLVNAFLDVYEWQTIQAKRHMGTLRNDADYPSRHTLAGKFDFIVNYSSVPDAGDFRVDVTKDQMTDLRSRYRQHYNAQIARAMGDVCSRAIDILTRLSSSLGYEDRVNTRTNKNGERQKNTTKKKKVSEGVFEAAIAMIDMLKTCNLTGDTQIQATVRMLEDHFRGAGRLALSIEDLREDAQSRLKTQEVLDAALDKLPTLDI